LRSSKPWGGGYAVSGGFDSHPFRFCWGIFEDCQEGVPDSADTIIISKHDFELALSYLNLRRVMQGSIFGDLPQDAKENLSGFRIEASGMTLEIGGASPAATKTANQSARNCSNTVALSRFTPKYHSKSNFLSCDKSQFRLRLNQDLPQLLM